MKCQNGKCQADPQVISFKGIYSTCILKPYILECQKYMSEAMLEVNIFLQTFIQSKITISKNSISQAKNHNSQAEPLVSLFGVPLWSPFTQRYSDKDSPTFTYSLTRLRAHQILTKLLTYGILIQCKCFKLAT